MFRLVCTEHSRLRPEVATEGDIVADHDDLVFFRMALLDPFDFSDEGSAGVAVEV